VRYAEIVVSKKGQGRRFDTDAALDVAMRLFWRHGYDGIGVADLAKAMGISASSLYAAFSNKKVLFEMTIAYYQEHYGNFTDIAVASSRDVGEFAKNVLHLAAAAFTRENLPKGCYVTSAPVNVSPDAEQAAATISNLRNKNISDMADHLDSAYPDELTNAGLSGAALSRYLAAVLQGMSQQSLDGCSKEQLDILADTATGAIDALLRAR
jgi:AcrR family transcriptional regulator